MQDKFENILYRNFGNEYTDSVNSILILILENFLNDLLFSSSSRFMSLSMSIDSFDTQFHLHLFSPTATVIG